MPNPNPKFSAAIKKTSNSILRLMDYENLGILSKKRMNCNYEHICMCCGASNHRNCGCYEKALENERKFKETMRLRKEQQATCVHEWQSIISGVDLTTVLARYCLPCGLVDA